MTPWRLRPAAAVASAGLLAVTGCQAGAVGGTTTTRTAPPSAPTPSAPTPSAPTPSAPTPTGSTPSGSTRSSSTGSAGVYAAAGAGRLTGAARGVRPWVYVPNSQGRRVDVIDPRTYKVVRSFPVGLQAQHVVPSWDKRTLWVNSSDGNTLTPVDARTGRVGKSVPVADPYNLYFTPDGRRALVMAERLRRIDIRDPRTMRLQRSLKVPCNGVNHLDFTADGAWMIASCEYSGKLLALPISLNRVAAVIDLNRQRSPGGTDPATTRPAGGAFASLDAGATSMPQDVRLTNDGRTFLVADLLRGGVWRVDARTRTVAGFVPTGRGAHGIYPSRDASRLLVTNRDAGSVSVLDAAGRKVLTRWKLPRGASPDMGGITADGRQLWLSGRYDSQVYVLDARTGRLLRRVPVGPSPHGLAVWPQPGRYSLGHTGNMR